MNQYLQSTMDRCMLMGYGPSQSQKGFGRFFSAVLPTSQPQGHLFSHDANVSKCLTTFLVLFWTWPQHAERQSHHPGLLPKAQRHVASCHHRSQAQATTNESIVPLPNLLAPAMQKGESGQD